MFLRPTSIEELAQSFAQMAARHETITGIDLSAFNQVLEYTPEDMTVTVQAGMTLAALQTHLARHRQWLPIDPPNAETTSIGAVLAGNSSGPRRFGYGTIREYLLGLRVMLGDGRVIKNGGKVVKNVAGYDLCKLFVGDHGSLGAVLEATFKLRPLLEAEQFVHAHCGSLEQADALIDAVFGSDLTPVVLDLHNASTGSPLATTFVAGFAGTREEVDWQLAQARALGVKIASNLDYEADFWSGPVLPYRLSILPSRLTEALRGLGKVRFVARAGSGVIYYRGGSKPPAAELPRELMRQIKNAFDPNRVLPDLPL